MYTYVKNDIEGNYRIYRQQLDPNLNNNLGSTYEDYLNGKWVLLTDQQIQFHLQFPEASVEEVLKSKLNPETDTYDDYLLQIAKEAKIYEIDEYNISDNVNSFTIGSEQMWLDFDDRSRIRTSIEAYKSTGAITMTKWFNGKEYTFTIEQWEYMLNILEVYAAEALNVTEQHKAYINSLNSIEDIQQFDVTLGYPNKLVF